MTATHVSRGSSTDDDHQFSRGGAVLKLSSQQYASVVTTLKLARGATGSERRQFTRISIQTKLELISLVGNTPKRRYTALSRDISVNGIGFMQFSPMTIGEQFVVCIPSAKEELLIVCRATFCGVLADGIFGIGSQFVALPEPEMLEGLKLIRDNDKLLERIRGSVLS